MPDLYEQLLASLTSGVLALDASGIIIMLNPAAARHLHADPALLAVGHPLAASASCAPLLEIFREVSATAQPVARRDILLTLDSGLRIEIGLSATPVMATAGLIGVVFLFTDMTERRTLERQAALNRQLLALGELTAGVVHELRGPVSVIAGMAELLLRKLPPGDERRKAADTILAEASALGRLASQFLGLARPHALDLALHAPKAIVDRALQWCRPRASRKDVTIKSQCDSGLPEFRVDADQAARALANILDNAIDASPPHGQVSIAARREGESILFAVTDEGAGLHLAPGEDPFSPFFSKKEDGTGLGLALVHRIVEAHHGAVRYANREKGGALFEVRFAIEPRADE